MYWFVFLVFIQKANNCKSCWDKEWYMDLVSPGLKLNETTKKAIQGKISAETNANKHKHSQDLNEALKWRAELLKTDIENAADFTGDITPSQLAEVFKGTPVNRIREVAVAFNKYSDSLEINTKDRIAHFFAQTGYETGGFTKNKGESGCFSETNTSGWHIWYTLSWKEKPYIVGCFDFTNDKKGKKKLPWTKIEDVPEDYICAGTNSGESLTKKFFSYVYQCEGGNGDAASEDGYKFRGHGMIQLTWKKTYALFDTWLNTNHKAVYKDVLENPTLLDKDADIYMLSGMWFWKTNGLNELADNDEFEDITKKINKGKEGEIERRRITDKLLE